MGGLEHLAAADEHGALEALPELADVARPGLGLQPAHRGRRQGDEAVEPVAHHRLHGDAERGGDRDGGAADVLGDALKFLRPNTDVTVLFYDGNGISLEPER